jgi:hypothetical protein
MGHIQREIHIITQFCALFYASTKQFKAKYFTGRPIMRVVRS